MPVSPEEAGECQNCGDEEATETVVVTIGGVPTGPLFVCDGCAEGGIAQ